MIDTLLHEMNRFEPPSCWESLRLEKGQYCVLTLHRPSNVDGEKHLEKVVASIMRNMGDFRYFSRSSLEPPSSWNAFMLLGQDSTVLIHYPTFSSITWFKTVWG